MTLEKSLITYCSPTLASIKTANLFSYSISSEEELTTELQCFNRRLGEKGISLEALFVCKNRALIYVYRSSRLRSDLEKAEVRTFLKQYGYLETEISSALNKLKERFRENRSFPHEIGLFLGYPLEDVAGFIKYEGKNFACCGCWKVYGNVHQTTKLFAKYQKCRISYVDLWENGRSLWQLTIGN